MENKRIDRRTIKTRTAINKAFLELFYKKDLELITINEIADLADLNRATIYLHYNDKYDLLDKLIEGHLNKLISFCDTDGQTPLRSEFLLIFEYIAEQFLFFSAMLNTSRATVFRSRLMKFIFDNMKSKLEDGGSDTWIDNELRAQFIASAFIGMLEWWVQHQMPHPPEYMAEQLCRLFEKNEVYA
ncbi:TetR/AcrR family transcriptional regulator [Paenibacillus gorillae]|uniref:TetR/AcrR family transcriptional regulator n=1 Tax=Paenibacillus gorillae TaxID=1243662 RepID=UPI0004B6063B|nr:TetR/AcrR family transcriptional regulator [Paenibacillus gorillae]